MADTLVVNEIYLSLQGESTFAGLPCVFVRLTGCNLRCSYCDTAYAFTEGKRRTLPGIVAEVKRLAEPFTHHASRITGEGGIKITNPSKIQDAGAGLTSINPQPALPLVEFTGGEPLLQPAALPLMTQLCDAGFTVLVETSGALDISRVDPRVRRIMDLKCPSSGEVARNRFDNIPHLKATDEIKFVIGAVEDYEWARAQIITHKLDTICPLLMSWVHPLRPEQQDKTLKPVPRGLTPMTRQQLAERILADALPVRFQLQMHKVIWPAEQRGV
ncbi:MAG: 7-carboxy-7-deazaguanine synthase [Limisphaerales bacterium]